MTEITNSLGQPNSAEGILGLAQKLYDEHVSEGEAIKSRLVSEAEVEAERVLFEAHAESERLHEEANEYHETKIADADREVQELIESSADRVSAIHENIAALQKFETHYRTELLKLLNDTKALIEVSDAVEEEKIEAVSDDTVDEDVQETTEIEEELTPELVAEELIETDENADENTNEEEDEEEKKPSAPVYVL